MYVKKLTKKNNFFSANCLQKPSGTQQRPWKTWRSTPAKLCHPTTFYHSEHEQKDCYWLQVSNFWLICSENVWIDLVSRLIDLKFIYSEKPPKFCEISNLLYSVDKSKVEISQNFVAFSEYTNFNITWARVNQN